MNLSSGIINVYKPRGISSYDVIRRIKKIMPQKDKIGHTGTLDPDACGVLPVCIGKATKLSSMLVDQKKEYIAVCRLGISTDTEDISGKIISSCIVPDVDLGVIENIIEKFTGVISQVPPMYSALKYRGKPLYKLAREGKEIQRNPREINIYSIDLLDFKNGDMKFKVVCSKGTYIRSLCRDIGAELGCGACMADLERTAVGCFNVENSVHADEFLNLSCADLAQKIISVDYVFRNYPEIFAGELIEKRFVNGASSRIRLQNGLYRVYSSKHNLFLGIAEVKNGILTQKQLFV